MTQEEKYIPAMIHAMIQVREKVKNLSAENEQLKAKLETAKEALRFYASPAEIGNLDGEILMRPIGSYEPFKERKELALAALKEIEGE